MQIKNLTLFFSCFSVMTASRRAKRIIITHVPSEEESSVLKEMAHGNGSNWKACLNLPQTNLREKFTHIKKENFRKSSNNVKNIHIDCLLGQRYSQSYSLAFKTSVYSHSTKSCAAVGSPRNYSDIIIYGFNSCWQPILFFNHNLHIRRKIRIIKRIIRKTLRLNNINTT